MGHSAKFGAMCCCTLPMMVHFALIQIEGKLMVYSSNVSEFHGQC